MARRTFFSFHYQEDVWRVFNVRKCLAFSKDQEADGFFDGSVFEASKRESDDALKTFLRRGLENTSVTCVLAGQHTATRRWVRYEIVRSVLKGNGLLTVDIHGLRNNEQELGVKGTDPLDEVGVYLSNGRIYFAEVKQGKWERYSDYLPSISASDLWFGVPSNNTIVKLSKHCMRDDFVDQNGRENILELIETAAVLVVR